MEVSLRICLFDNRNGIDGYDHRLRHREATRRLLVFLCGDQWHCWAWNQGRESTREQCSRQVEGSYSSSVYFSKSFS